MKAVTQWNWRVLPADMKDFGHQLDQGDSHQRDFKTWSRSWTSIFQTKIHSKVAVIRDLYSEVKEKFFFSASWSYVMKLVRKHLCEFLKPAWRMHFHNMFKKKRNFLAMCWITHPTRKFTRKQIRNDSIILRLKTILLSKIEEAEIWK